MRKRRTDAKIRVAIRAFLAGEVGVIETCQFLTPALFLDKELLDEQGREFVLRVAGHASASFVIKEWHPDFLASKLESITAYEESVRAEVRSICEQILEVMELRKLANK